MTKPKRVRCAARGGYLVSLTVGKAYDVLDTVVTDDNTLRAVRITDDSGEAYWFPADLFKPED